MTKFINKIYYVTYTMDLVTLWSLVKIYKFSSILLVTNIIFLVIIILILKIDLFGVKKFKKEFYKIFKSIKKKVRSNKPISFAESGDILIQIKKLKEIHSKIFLSLNNAYGFKEKHKLSELENLKKIYLKLTDFEKYISTYYDQIKQYDKANEIPLRVAEQLKEGEKIWK